MYDCDLPRWDTTRQDPLTTGQFERRFVEPLRPVIVTDVGAAAWPAAEGAHAWTLEKLMPRFPDQSMCTCIYWKRRRPRMDTGKIDVPVPGPVSMHLHILEAAILEFSG